MRVIEASVRIRVRGGSVVLDRPAGRLDVSAGHELFVNRDGRTDLSDLPAFGADWKWPAEITPMLELEGRSLRDFLNWEVRERGLSLSFASPELPASASRIVLSGSVQGMTLDEALDSVLPTCGMTYRIQEDTLIIGK